MVPSVTLTLTHHVQNGIESTVRVLNVLNDMVELTNRQTKKIREFHENKYPSEYMSLVSADVHLQTCRPMQVKQTKGTRG